MKKKNRSLPRRPRVEANPSFDYNQLEDRHPLAALQIIAAGETNQETLVLQIDNQVVRTWTNLGGDAAADQFVTLTHSTTGPLNPSQIRLAGPSGRN